MKKLISILLIALAATGRTACAQNSIDNAMEMFSTLGNSTYKSIVERDPKTHKVIKVVKTLETRRQNASKLVNAFEKEAESGSYTVTTTDNTTEFLLTVETPRQNRIYALRINGRLPHASNSHCLATAIIKIKQKE